MDVATLFGFVAGLALVTFAVVFGGSGSAFIHGPSVLIMLGGITSALFLNFRTRQIRNSLSIASKCFVQTPRDPATLVEEIRQHALTVRRHGLRSMEILAEKADDPLMRLGFDLVSNECSSEELTAAFQREKQQVTQRHVSGRRLFEVLGAAAPAWGMVGTLIGLIQMLGNLQDPRQIGSGLALALLTTLYGALFSNLACLPIAGKLESRQADEESFYDAVCQGFQALLEEHRPARVEGRLRAWSPTARDGVEIERAKAS